MSERNSVVRRAHDSAITDIALDDVALDDTAPDDTAADDMVADGTGDHMTSDVLRSGSDCGDPDRGGPRDGSVERMLAALPAGSRYESAALRECIEATQECAHAATACADACLDEEMVAELIGCVRVLLNAADVCAVTARVLSRATRPDRTLTSALLSSCWVACRRAREVCEEFLPIHHHCQVCARACRAAERSCRALLTAVRADGVPPAATRNGDVRLRRSR